MKIVSSALLVLGAAVGFSSSLLAQQEPPTPPTPAAGTAGADAPGGNPRGPRGDRPRGNFNPEEMRARMLASLREQLGVTKDDEWTLISDRINAVFEARRASSPMGAFMGRPGGPGGPGGGPDGQGRRNRPGNPELEALQAAIKDNAPDAEVQARLAKVRDVRKENEAKVTKAQEDLRAILNVRQEAILVTAGILP